MDLKLNVYNKKEVAKTYTAETYDLMFGTVEDIIDLVDLDELNTGSDTELLKIVGKAVAKGMNVIKPLIKDIFDGLTDEELRNTRASEITTVLVEVIKYAIEEIGKGAKGKN